MNSKKDLMDSEDEYDQMLRTMFESCDTVGLGLLTPKDFENLCYKLSIQEHSSLLAAVLFPETNKRKLVSYENFRDTLILFLTGDAGFANCSTGDNKNTHLDSEDHCNNISGENRIESQPKSEYPEDILSKDPLHPSGKKFTGYNVPSPDSQQKYRRYGRKSKPNMDFLSNCISVDGERPVVLREVHLESTQHLCSTDDVATDYSPWKAVEVSFLSEEDSTPIAMNEEEFAEEGNADAWKTPDSGWMSEMNANTEDSKVTKVIHTVQTELEMAWASVVGDPLTDTLCVSQLGSLCTELGLDHIGSSDDISELFAALDSDDDEIVTFREFSEQMSMFIYCDESNPVVTGDDRRTPERDLPETALDSDNDGVVTFRESSEQMSTYINCDESNPVVTGDDRRTPEKDLPETDNINGFRDCVFSPWEIIEEDGTSISRTMMSQTNDVRTNHVTSRPQTPVDINDTFECAIESSSDISTPARYEISSPARSATTSEDPRTPECWCRLSIDSDTSPLRPPVVSVDLVEPRQLAAINRGRRRRRSSTVAASNPTGVRQQRRKCSRSIPLPHHYPASIRKLEELPLSFLTDENERYISLDALRQSWEQEGLEDSSAVLEALELSSSDQSVSVEALTEVLEMELGQNIIQKAALILYKSGISHYRSMIDHERAERSKHESNIDHLMSQLQEREERLEKAESNFREKADEMEAKYKREIRALADELGVAQERIKEHERESQSYREEELNRLAEKYEKSQGFLEELRKENEKLWKEREDEESRLMDAEDAVMKMQEDLDAACRGIAQSNRQIASQRKQYADLLRMYEEQSQSMQDGNDKLFDRLQQSRRRWSSPCRSKSQSMRRQTSGSSAMLRHNDPSSYSSASEESHHLSTCQLFVNDLPKHKEPQEHFMTPSPTSEIRGELARSNAFAFLTPTTARAKSRVQSYASLAIAPPSSSSEDRLTL